MSFPMRLYRIDQMIQEAGLVSFETLRSALQCSAPTLKRDLRFMRERGIDIPKKLSEEIATVVVCAMDGKYAGHLLLSDRLKPDAAEAINRLKQMGMKDIRLLSGDKPEIVTAFANQLGINKAYGNLLPEDKAEQIRRLTEEPGRSVAFVGDGMNDAPVLALSRTPPSRAPTWFCRTTSRRRWRPPFASDGQLVRLSGRTSSVHWESKSLSFWQVRWDMPRFGQQSLPMWVSRCWRS